MNFVWEKLLYIHL